jgi:hypothetical protein
MIETMAGQKSTLNKPASPVIAETKRINACGSGDNQVGWHREQNAPRPNRMRAFFVFS